MFEKSENSIDAPNKERVAITAVLAFCTALSGSCADDTSKNEAIMPIIQDDGSVLNCPVDLDCAEEKTSINQIEGCIDFFRCKSPFEQSDSGTETKE